MHLRQHFGDYNIPKIDLTHRIYYFAVVKSLKFNCLTEIKQIRQKRKLVGIDWSLLSSPSNCHDFVNIVRTICIDYLFLYYNISDALKIFISGEKLREFS